MPEIATKPISREAVPETGYLPRGIKAIERIRKVLTSFVRSAGQVQPKLIIVLLSRENQAIYAGVKYTCDIELGVHSVHKKHSLKKKTQYFANISLKINIKFGGIKILTRRVKRCVIMSHCRFIYSLLSRRSGV